MTEHSDKIGGSSAKRAIKCPGSIALSRQIPSVLDTSSDAANTGTALHAVMEMLMTDFDKQPEDFIGAEITVAEETEEAEAVTVTITEDHVNEMINPALDALDEFMELLEQEAGEPAQVMAEKRVEFTKPLVGCFGTSDLLGAAGEIGFSLDWKFGTGVKVEAENNTQNRFYMAAALETPLVKGLFQHCSRYFLAVVQPAHKDGGPKWSYEEVSYADLAALRVSLEQALMQSMKPEPVLQIGKHCRFCPALPICPQHHNRAAEVLERDPVAVIPDGAASFEGIDLDALAEDLEIARELGQWIKAVETMALTLADDHDQKIPGYKLVAGRATNRWADADKTVEWMKKKRIAAKTFMPPALLSVAQARKAGIKFPDELVKTTRGVRLAEESDPKPALEKPPAKLGKIAAKMKARVG